MPSNDGHWVIGIELWFNEALLSGSQRQYDLGVAYFTIFLPVGIGPESL